MATQASRIYHEERIASHTQQLRATFCLFSYLIRAYGYRRLERHLGRLKAAVENIEKRLHSEAL